MRNLPQRPSDLSLQDSLFTEYNKLSPHGVRAVRLQHCGNENNGGDHNEEDRVRLAVIYLNSKSDLPKLLDESRGKHFMGATLEADVFLLNDELIDDK